MGSRFRLLRRTSPWVLALALLLGVLGARVRTIRNGDFAPLPPPGTESWGTDWSRRTVSPGEFARGGPPRDGIPPIDRPSFRPASEAALLDDEPVISLAIGTDARAYPLRILLWHEVVNDTVGGVPVAVTFCPLAHAAVVFDRRVEGSVFSFGVSGLLRNSDLVMWDRETESLWQQFTGDGLVGTHAGRRLAMRAVAILPASEFRSRHPDGGVLEEADAARPYGTNPYEGYSRSDRPFLFRGIPDPRLPALARVAGAVVDGTPIAFPLAEVARRGEIEEEVGGTKIVARFHPQTLDALDAGRIARSRRIGSVTIERADGTTLPHLDTYWFAWAAFHAGTGLWSRR